MTKISKQLWAVLLTISILCGAALPVSADEAQRTLTIRTAEDLQKFSENCILDSYSRDLLVTLEANVDLTGQQFQDVPVFCGTFDGNSHTISGLSCTEEGSTQGFFRYLTKEASVKNLKLIGTVLPEGSRKEVGGLAGSNAGTIEHCSFHGETGGSEQIGGLVGINLETGLIRGCEVTGTVHGDHFVGGIAGVNQGLIEACSNGASVNTTEHQNTVELSDITMESLVKTENVITVTDIGGISGRNDGAILNSRNRGPIGYPHMGYNIGGITGSQVGYLKGCTNYGTVYGRKEVGGIVGQMEPVNRIEFTIDTLQSLQQQLKTLTGMANQASVNAQNSASFMNSGLSTIREQSAMAVEAISWLIPDPFDFKLDLPDLEDVIVAHNVITGSMGTIHQTMDQMARDTRESVGQLTKDMQAIAYQLAVMSQTISDAPDQLGGKITDVSDMDQETDFTGKAESCLNQGVVNGDLNVGGIVGAVDWENDLDPEDDFQVGGERSLNFESELRAVIRDCHNEAEITVKKQSAGGIVGRLAMGLVRQCSNSGPVIGPQAVNLGGIAGYSIGFLRENSVKCELWGDSKLGGIAGSASVVTDCSSMTKIHGGREKMGAILGSEEPDYKGLADPITRNVYLAMEEAPGAIDGISYAEKAYPCDQEEFRAAHPLPKAFYQTTVTFLKEDSGVVKRIAVKTGEGISRTQIPPVPEKAGYTGQWERLSETDLSGIYFDLTFRPVYTPFETTICSEQQRENGKAIILAEGAFPSADAFVLERLEEAPGFEEGTTYLEGWQIPKLSEDRLVLRYALPPTDEDNLQILVHRKEGDWRAVPYTESGSYLVFGTEPADDAFCLTTVEKDLSVLLLPVGSVAALVILAVVFFLIRHRKRKHVKYAGSPKDINKKL